MFHFSWGKACMRVTWDRGAFHGTSWSRSVALSVKYHFRNTFRDTIRWRRTSSTLPCNLINLDVGKRFGSTLKPGNRFHSRSKRQGRWWHQHYDLEAFSILDTMNIESGVVIKCLNTLRTAVWARWRIEQRCEPCSWISFHHPLWRTSNHLINVSLPAFFPLLQRSFCSDFTILTHHFH